MKKRILITSILCLAIGACGSNRVLMSGLTGDTGGSQDTPPPGGGNGSTDPVEPAEETGKRLTDYQIEFDEIYSTSESYPQFAAQGLINGFGVAFRAETRPAVYPQNLILEFVKEYSNDCIHLAERIRGTKLNLSIRAWGREDVALSTDSSVAQPNPEDPPPRLIKIYQVEKCEVVANDTDPTDPPVPAGDELDILFSQIDSIDQYFAEPKASTYRGPAISISINNNKPILSAYLALSIPEQYSNDSLRGNCHYLAKLSQSEKWDFHVTGIGRIDVPTPELSSNDIAKKVLNGAIHKLRACRLVASN